MRAPRRDLGQPVVVRSGRRRRRRCPPRSAPWLVPLLELPVLHAAEIDAAEALAEVGQLDPRRPSPRATLVPRQAAAPAACASRTTSGPGLSTRTCPTGALVINARAGVGATSTAWRRIPAGAAPATTPSTAWRLCPAGADEALELWLRADNSHAATHVGVLDRAPEVLPRDGHRVPGPGCAGSASLALGRCDRRGQWPQQSLLLSRTLFQRHWPYAYDRGARRVDRCRSTLLAVGIWVSSTESASQTIIHLLRTQA